MTSERQALERGAVSFAATAASLAALSGYALKVAIVKGDVVAQAQCAAAIGGYVALFFVAWWIEGRRRRAADGRIWALAECRLALVLVPLFGTVWGIEGASALLGASLAGGLWLAGIVDGVCVRRLAGGRCSAIPRAGGRIWGCWGDWVNGGADRDPGAREFGGRADLAGTYRGAGARQSPLAGPGDKGS